MLSPVPVWCLASEEEHRRSMETPQNASEESKEEHEEDREDEEDKHSPSITDILQLKKKCYDEPSAESLPQPYKQNSHQENLYLWATVNYRKQVCRANF